MRPESANGSRRLDRDAVAEALHRAGPEVVVPEAAALARITGNPRRLAKEFD